MKSLSDWTGQSRRISGDGLIGGLREFVFHPRNIKDAKDAGDLARLFLPFTSKNVSWLSELQAQNCSAGDSSVVKIM